MFHVEQLPYTRQKFIGANANGASLARFSALMRRTLQSDNHRQSISLLCTTLIYPQEIIFLCTNRPHLSQCNPQLCTELYTFIHNAAQKNACPAVF